MQYTHMLPSSVSFNSKGSLEIRVRRLCKRTLRFSKRVKAAGSAADGSWLKVKAVRSIV
jgi:hypothetical protein